MASSKETYCLCGQPYNIGQFMIECDCCREWFHGSCVNVKVYQSDDIDKYHCPKCVPTYGPSVFKIPTNSHRADRYEIGAESRPPQAGTPAWVRSLAEAPLRPTAAALQRLRPQQFTEEFVRDNGFTRPILFQTNDGLDMKIPNPATFTVRSVLRYVGAQHEVEVIDVRKQASVRMPLAEFVDYFETPPDHRDNRVLNILSLEISDTKLSALVEPPGALRSLDWTARVWAGDAAPRPLVQKYCLVSAAGAYTDFHLDFGGTTVWYHVLHGQKIFYLIPPTSTNLALYQQWCSSPTQSETYFADLVEWYGTAELCAGQTLFIPSGWIHAVLTPRDSLVFGGNLLHSYAIETQLQVYEIERRVETPLQFRYPLFETMNWYAAVHLLTTLRRHNEEIQDEEFTLSEVPSRTPAALPPLLLRGIKILASALKEWHALKASDPVKRDNVPKCLNSGQLVRELCKELRILEKRTANTASKDKDYKVKSTGSPNKTKKQQTPAKKSLKLTLPKPIMHMAQNGDFPDDKIYAEKFYIDDKEIYTQDRYTPQDLKYNNIDPKYIVDNTGKYIIENTKIIDNGKYIDSNIKFVDSNGKYVENSEKYMDTEGKYVDSNGKYIDSVDNNGKYMDTEAKYVDSNGKFVDADGKYVDPNGKYVDNKYMIDNGTKYVVDGDGKFVIDNKDIDDKGYVYQTFEEVQYQDGFVDRIDKKTTVLKMKLSGPPPPYPCESILKSQLAGRGRPPAHWTISARDHADHLLYTNDGPRPPQAHPPYGPGMYSAEDVPQDFQYSGSTKAGPYPTEYGFDQYYRYEEIPQEVHQPTPVAVGVPPVAAGAPPPQYTALPSYAAAVGQYAVPPAEDTYVPPPPAAAPPPGAPRVRRSCRASRRRVSASFDYEDTDLYIDVPPPPRQRHKQASTSESYRAAPANGIESLIQASELADGPADDDTGDNTSDAAAAVAGMLSIGGSVPHNATFGLPQPSTKSPSSSKRARKSVVSTKSASAGDSSADEETADVIREVHRDDEYVYPSLEMSSDEDEEWTASKKRKHSRSKLDRTKQERDESWSPRGRVGRLVPRVRCAPRPTRRECVRAALTHAAKREHTPTHNQNAKRAVIATKSKRPPPPPPPPVQPTPNNNKNNMRLKKGMKTAKQRLGKILKIHKMIY